MLSAGCRYSIVNCALVFIAAHQRINQSSSEAVASSQAIHDINAVCRRKENILVTVKHPGPIIARCRQAAAKRNRNSLELKALCQLMGYADITVPADSSRVQVSIRNRNTENSLGVLLVGYADIHIRH